MMRRKFTIGAWGFTCAALAAVLTAHSQVVQVGVDVLLFQTPSQPYLEVQLEIPAVLLPLQPNEGGWQDLYNIFLEPATGSLDRLDVAGLNGQHSTVEGGGT